MFIAHGYAKIKELRGLLRERVAQYPDKKKIFMLPSMKSGDGLVEILRGDGSYFGKRPEIWSWSDMYRALVPRKALKRQIDPPDHKMILKHILTRNIAELDARAILIPAGARRGGFVEVLSSAIRELLLEGVAPDRLISGGKLESYGGAISQRDLLYRLYTDYLLYLEDNELVDNSQIPSIVADLVSCAVPRYLEGAVLFWVGFLSHTGSQVRLLKALNEKNVRVEVFAPQSGLSGFRDISEQLELKIRRSDEEEARVLYITAVDSYAELDRVARELALARAGRGSLRSAARCPHCASELAHLPDEEIFCDVGILADRALGKRLSALLDKYSIEHQLWEELAVSETSVFGFLRRVWETHRLGWPTRRTLHVLSDALLPVKIARAEVVWKMRPEGVAVWRKTLFELGEEAILRHFDRLCKFCDYLDDPQGHTAYELLSELLELLTEACWEDNLAVNVEDAPELDSKVREVAAVRIETGQKVEMLRELTPTIGEAGLVRYSGNEAYTLLSDWASEATIALPQKLTGLVTIYTAIPDVLTSHRIWIVTGVEPGKYPAAMKDHLLLDSTIRDDVNIRSETEPVHLPTLHEKREHDEATFRRILLLGDEITIVSRAENDSQGRPQGDSPFMANLGRPWGSAPNPAGDLVPRPRIEGQKIEKTSLLFQAEPEKINDLSNLSTHNPGVRGISPPAGFGAEPQGLPLQWNIWRIAAGATVLADLSEPLLVPGGVNLLSRQLYRGEFPRVVGGVDSDADVEKHHFAASHIDEWIDCPFSYWCGRMARLAQPENHDHYFSRLEQGLFMHSVWEYLWEGLYDERFDSLEEVVANSWSGIVDHFAPRYPQIADRRSVPLLAELRGKIALMAAKQDDIERRAAEAGIYRSSPPQFEYRLQPLELTNVVFTGIADRIDFWQGVGAVIVDYKLGSSLALSNSLQLAAYAVMLERVEDMPVAGYCFMAHGDSAVKGVWNPELEGIYSTSKPAAKAVTFAERLVLVDEQMEAIDSAFAERKFRANYESKRCANCSYGTLCRKSERLGARRESDGDE